MVANIFYQRRVTEHTSVFAANHKLAALVRTFNWKHFGYLGNALRVWVHVTEIFPHYYTKSGHNMQFHNCHFHIQPPTPALSLLGACPESRDVHWNMTEGFGIKDVGKPNHCEAILMQSCDGENP